MSGRNTSSAVMQQRVEAHDSLDDFPTPPWATRALCAFLAGIGQPLHLLEVREPAANRGHMVRPLGEYFDRVEASDIHDYGMGYVQRDYLFGPLPDPVDWTITNPPFRLAERFIQRALATSRVGCAVLVRSSFIEGRGRYEGLFRNTPEAYFLPFVERVVMWKGVLLDPDVPIRRWNEGRGVFEVKKPSSATSYAWLIFLKGHSGMGRVSRIAPCRARLTRPGDYPPVPKELRADAMSEGAGW